MMKPFFSIILLLLASNLLAADHLVTSINEANKLLKDAPAGDRVILKNGIYRNAVIRFHNTNGTKDQQVTFAAQTPGQVFFEGNSTLAFSGNYIRVDGFTWRNGGDSLGNRTVIDGRTAADKLANYSTLSNCAIINYNSDSSIDNKWVGLHGVYNTVTHCLFKDKRNLGATLTVWLIPGKEAHHTISYNYFYGRHNGPNQDNGLESIRIGDSKTSFENAHCVVALNLFEECNGEIEIISNKSCYNSYLHNSFVNSDGGLTLRHGNNCLVDGNFFNGGGKPLAYGVRFIGEGHMAINNYFVNLNAAAKQNFRAPVTLVTGVVNTPINGYFEVRRAVVAHNIFVNCAAPNIRLGATPKRDGATLSPDTVLIKDNLFYNDAGNNGEVYEEVLPCNNVNIENNTIVAKQLRATGKGFLTVSFKGATRQGYAYIKDGKGKMLASCTNKSSVTGFNQVGANWIQPSLQEQLKGRKYTHLSAKDVGPMWMAGSKVAN